ncbi:MAG: Rrf2 family transcriptional regulator [Anaerolineae bacterium]|jgi:Rrf2 family iron-sulfur cluster assembly transcriptional regulator
MIRITTRGRYALRAMLDLALHGGDGPVARHEIAERQDISADYVAQLFQKLQDAGLVEGVKGPGGGYRLAHAPGEIGTGDVVEAVEGPVALVHCVEPDGRSSCSRVDGCVTHLLWKRLSLLIKEFLDATTLQDLVDEAQQLQRSSSPDGACEARGTPSCGMWHSTISSGSDGG